MTTVEPLASEVETVIRDTLAAHHSMYMATAGTAGPWASGVYFAEVGPFTLVLVLEAYGRTLTAIRENPVVGLVVSTGSPAQPFLQGRANAEVLEGEDDDEVRRVLLAKVPEAAPFMDAPIKALRLRVPSWRVTDVMNGWLPGKELAAPES